MAALTACSGSSWEVGTPEIVEVEPLPTLFRTRTPTYTPLPPTPSPVPTLPTRTPRPTPTPMDSVKVVIAVQNIPFNAPIPPEAVRLVDWPLAALPGNTFNDLDDVIGQVSVVRIACNEPVLQTLIGWREIGIGFDPLPDCPPDNVATATTDTLLVNIVVSTRRIGPGEVISPDAVALRPWPANFLPPAAHTSLTAVIGERAAAEILREQPVLDGKLRQ